MADRIWALAQIVDSRQGHVRLRFSEPESCQRCNRGGGCGAGVFGGLFVTGPFEIELPRDREMCSGDWVRVGIDRATMVTGAISAYGLPLAAFLVTIWLVALSGIAEGMVLIAGLVIGCLAHLAGRHRLTVARNLELVPLSATAGYDDHK